MKQNYFLIVGVLLLLLVGGYFGVQKFSGNGVEDIVDNNKVIGKRKKMIKVELQNNKILFYSEDNEVVKTIDINEQNPFELNNRKPFNSKQELNYNIDLLITNSDIDYFEVDNSNNMDKVIWLDYNVNLSKMKYGGYGAIIYTAILKTPGSYDVAERLGLASYLYLVNPEGKITEKVLFKGEELNLVSLRPQGDYVLVKKTNSLTNPASPALRGEFKNENRIIYINKKKDISDSISDFDYYYGFLNNGYYVSNILDKSNAPYYEITFKDLTSGKKFSKSYDSKLFRAFVKEDGLYLQNKETKIKEKTFEFKL